MSQAFYDQWPALFAEAHALAGERGHMVRQRLTIITPTIRPAGALEVARSIQVANPHPLEIRHIIAYWPSAPDESRQEVAPWFTKIVREVKDGWLMIVDDDNRLHPDLPARLAQLLDVARDDAGAFVFDMAYPELGGRLRCGPECMTPGRVDGGQVVLWWALAEMEPWRSGSMGDGEYLAALYRSHAKNFVFVHEVLTYHNHQRWSSG
jgi:hypothetical protein